jgi:hypothetical protein
MKMKGVYEQNPALGDPMSIEGQLNESGHKLDKLRQELQKYQGYLEEAVEGVNNKLGQQSGVVLSVSPSAPSRRNKGIAPGHHLNGGHFHRQQRLLYTNNINKNNVCICCVIKFCPEVRTSYHEMTCISYPHALLFF